MYSEYSTNEANLKNNTKYETLVRLSFDHTWGILQSLLLLGKAVCKGCRPVLGQTSCYCTYLLTDKTAEDVDVPLGDSGAPIKQPSRLK